MGQSPAGVSRFTKSSARWVVETTVENVTGLLGLQAPPTRSDTVLIYARRGLYGFKTDPNQKKAFTEREHNLQCFFPLTHESARCTRIFGVSHICRLRALLPGGSLHVSGLPSALLGTGACSPLSRPLWPPHTLGGPRPFDAPRFAVVCVLARAIWSLVFGVAEVSVGASCFPATLE